MINMKLLAVVTPPSIYNKLYLWNQLHTQNYLYIGLDQPVTVFVILGVYNTIRRWDLKQMCELVSSYLGCVPFVITPG